MAGSYPDAPGRRFAWDADGTVVLYDSGTDGNMGGGGAPVNPWNAATAQESQNGNDEDWATIFRRFNSPGVPDAYVLTAFVFPEDREIDGAWINGTMNNSDLWLYTSVDSTNGIDGTWLSTVADWSSGFTATSTLEAYRDEILSLAVANVASIKFHIENTPSSSDAILRRMHFYGVISPGATPDRIVFLDTDNADAVFTSVLDYGDVPRGQTQQRTIKVKNNSASKTINTVQITAEDLYLNAGGWYTFSDDDVTYSATLALGNIANGATQLVYVKQIIPDAETLGLQAGRIKVSHASLT